MVLIQHVRVVVTGAGRVVAGIIVQASVSQQDSEVDDFLCLLLMLTGCPSVNHRASLSLRWSLSALVFVCLVL